MRFHFALLSLVFVCAGTGAVAQSSPTAISCAELHLVPAPRECKAVVAVRVDQSGVRVISERNTEDEFAAKDLEEGLKNRSVPMGAHSTANVSPARVLI